MLRDTAHVEDPAGQVDACEARNGADRIHQAAPLVKIDVKYKYPKITDE